MRTEYYIPILVLAGVAVYFMFRRPENGNMSQDPVKSPAISTEETIRQVRSIFLKARRRFADLRKERKAIVEDYSKQAEALKIEQVRKNLDSI